MAIQFAIAPEQEARVVELAAAKGIAPGEYVGEVIADILTWEQPMIAGKSKEDIRDFFDRLEGMSRHIDTLKTETFSREMIYADDDIVL